MSGGAASLLVGDFACSAAQAIWLVDRARQFAHLLDGKAEAATALDEGQAALGRLTVNPFSARRGGLAGNGPICSWRRMVSTEHPACRASAPMHRHGNGPISNLSLAACTCWRSGWQGRWQDLREPLAYVSYLVIRSDECAEFRRTCMDPARSHQNGPWGESKGSITSPTISN